MKNNYLFQGAYSELDDDIGWNDFALRNYDAQIGRWVQQDPYQEFASPYVGMGDDPINLTDPSGGSILDGLSGVARVAVTTVGGAIIGLAVDLISGGDGGKGLLIGAGVGLVAGLGSLIQQITLSMGIQTMNVATTIINSSVKTEQAGKQALGSNAVQRGKQFAGPHAGGGENDFGFTNDDDNSLDFSNEEVNGKAAWPIWPILRWVIKRAGPPLVRWAIRTAKEGKIVRELLKKLEKIEKYSPEKYKHFEKILKNDGIKKLLESRKNIGKRLQEHIRDYIKYKKEGGYTSHTEREIKNFLQDIDAINDLLKEVFKIKF